MAWSTSYIALVFLLVSAHFISLTTCSCCNTGPYYNYPGLPCKTYYMTKMDCSERGLLELPPLDQNWTTALDLSYNSLVNITGAPFEKLHVLLVLNLRNNDISNLSSSAFKGLFLLEQLTLRRNKLVSLPNDIFSDLHNLVVLYLDVNYFTAIPSQALAPLRSLGLFALSNPYQDIPFFAEIDLEGFRNLTALNKLYLFTYALEANVSSTTLYPLQHVPLEELSIVFWWKDLSYFINKELFSKLTGITSLTIQFSALPAVASLHTPLERFIVLRDQVPQNVKAVDEKSFQILQKWNISLKQLTVRLGTLKTIEDYTFKWTQFLFNLDLDNNEINYVAKDAFYGLKFLQTLTLSRNKLADLPYDALQIFRKSSSLQHLDLSLNRITGSIDRNIFPSSLTYLSLDISYKSSSVSTNWIALFQNLTHLTLSVRETASGILLESKQSVPSLQTLSIENLGSMKVETALCNLFPSLEIIALADMNFADKTSLLSILHLQTCFHLEEFDLSGALIQGKSVDFVSLNVLNITISSLEKLKLTRNQLSSIKTIFFIKAPKLTGLDLAENKITTIDNEIAASYPGIVYLDVQDNEIASLLGLKNLHFLKGFYAAGNKITEVPTWLVYRTKTLQTLDLSNNPFHCTCKIESFRKWILSDEHTLLLPGQYVCTSPANLKLMSITAIELDCKSKTAFYLSATIPSVLLFCIVIIILLRYRWHIKYKLFLLYRICCPFPDIANDFEMLQLQYHAYVAYNERDEAWVMNDLQPNMEEGPEPVHLCIKSRDFIPGHFLLDSIDRSIHQSRKTILVLSRNFVESEWCYHEMRMAQMRLLDDHLDVLILVLLNEIPENKMTLSLRQILCRKDYIKWPKDRAGQNLFWQRLRQEIKGPVQVDRCFNF